MPAPQSLPAEFAEPLGRVSARVGPFARRVLWYADVTSTNDVAMGFAERGVQEGCVVVADAQSAGRGRHGRTWVSPPGAGLYVSVVLRPQPRVIPLLTLAAGVALADGIGDATGLAVQLKWPNDVYVGGRKLAGILAEAGVSSAAEPYVVLGFGINVLPAAYPADVAGRATSLEAELGRPADRGLVLASCLAALASRYQMLRDGERSAVIADWRTRARPLLGRAVEWDATEGVRRGVAEDVDDRGALLVRTPDGPARIVSGEVRWV